MKEIDEIKESLIGVAIAVHRAPGPGLLESAYEACLAYELVDRFNVKVLKDGIHRLINN